MKRKVREERQRRRGARRARVRGRIAPSARTRLTVYRSSKHIYAQLVDPVTGRTVGTISTRSKQIRGDATSTGNVESARRVERVVFNRNGFLFHGRVRALAEAAREAGLQF
jgi:large subunit ribosomal protein L18